MRAIPATSADELALEGLLPALASGDDREREPAFLAIRELGAREPALLAARLDRIAPLLDSPNGFHRSIGAMLIATAAPGDRERRIDGLLDRYLDLLDDPSVMVARYAVQGLVAIVAARPDLEARATDRLLAIDSTNHAASRLALLKADVIQAFDGWAEGSPSRGRIIAFVQRQLGSESPKTRAAAKAFLRAHL